MIKKILSYRFILISIYTIVLLFLSFFVLSLTADLIIENFYVNLLFFFVFKITFPVFLVMGMYRVGEKILRREDLWPSIAQGFILVAFGLFSFFWVTAQSICLDDSPTGGVQYDLLSQTCTAQRSCSSPQPWFTVSGCPGVSTVDEKEQIIIKSFPLLYGY